MFCHNGLIAFIVLFSKFQQFTAQENSGFPPTPTFQILEPNQIRISIPNEIGQQFFAFNGNINKRIEVNSAGEISGEAFRARDGKWTIQTRHGTLRNGDILYYWIQGQVNGTMYKKVDQWIVRTTEGDEGHQGETSAWTLSFNEDFDSLQESVWERDIRIPLGPDYEFCTYHSERNPAFLQIHNGKLRFKPLILEDQYGDRATAFGRMKVSGCTSLIPEECERNATAFSILPPVLSSRLTTKKSFNFRYGKIEIRAKFPQGDWLYPEMYLQPLSNVHGYGYLSGRVILGLARGNDDLVDRNRNRTFDSRKLDFGVRFGTSTHVDEYIVDKIKEFGPKWTEDFHVYTTVWNRNGFTFSVDDEKVGQLSPESDGWLHNCSYDKMAPFDQQFHISIGLGVGGIRVFPDAVESSNHKKPWRNIGAKAMLQFWQAKDDWLPTWRKNDSIMTNFEIDYIRVWSV
ncbi:beta-1,3-glucan-binding protein [Lasioglossum baleicum]|uniref:beta-1,3-glucan-binding protein n=1 Tax=Lasioglossum baleicum TaxID=434251 RepID=UPI003FCE75F0